MKFDDCIKANISDAELIAALKLIRTVCGEHSQCSTCPLGMPTNECVLESKPPTNYIITEEDIWRAVR